MSKNFYDILGVSKSSSQDEIKKAYRKLAMKYHPDRTKGDKVHEQKFKEINQAYDTLSDVKKRKNYDTFGSAGANFGGNPFSGGNSSSYSYSNFSNIEDIFGGFGGQQQTSGFDFGDLFGNFSQTQTRTSEEKKQKKIERDITKTYEVPLFDLLLGCKIEVTGDDGKSAKLKIPENTKPGTKFRVKGFGKTISGKTGNLYVLVDVKMPKHISDIDKNLLNSIRDNIGY